MTDVLTSNGSPVCSECEGFVKPDVVFFGEPLPRRFHALAEQVRVCVLCLYINQLPCMSTMWRLL